MARHGHALSDPSLAGWVIEECAELCAQDGWAALRLGELFSRLANMHRFFPQPRLVVAYHETLRAFIPWLALHGRLERERAVGMLEELERHGAPLLERARATLLSRRAT